MTQVILDSSGYSEFRRGRPTLRKYFVKDTEIILPVVVIGELRAGFAAGQWLSENEKLLRQFMDLPNVTIAKITDKTTRIYAQLFVELRQKGLPIGQNDMWIAALALELDTPLLTFDKDFSHINNLQLVSG